MKSTVDKLEETLKTEGEKNSKDQKFKEFEQLIEQIENLGYSQRPNYSFPLVDTIGKTTYSALNKHTR